MKTFAQLLVRRPAIFWTVLVTIFVFGALLRIQTIDRGTPWLGIAVYLTLLLLFVATFALPAGIVGGALARWLLRWSITPWQTRMASAVVVAFIVFAAHTLGRTLPPWHVWATASTIAARGRVSTILASCVTKMRQWMREALRRTGWFPRSSDAPKQTRRIFVTLRGAFSPFGKSGARCCCEVLGTSLSSKPEPPHSSK